MPDLNPIGIAGSLLVIGVIFACGFVAGALVTMWGLRP